LPKQRRLVGLTNLLGTVSNNCPTKIACDYDYDYDACDYDVGQSRKYPEMEDG
jgi:hypothetical protein